MAENPNVAEYQDELAKNYNNLGLLQFDLGKRETALESHHQARAIRKKLVANNPTMTLYSVDLGGSYCNIANVLAGTDPIESIEWYGKAIDTLRSVVARDTQNATAAQFLRNSYRGRAITRNQLSRYTAAADDWAQTIRLSAGANRDFFRMQRCRSLARAENHRRATAEAEKLVSNLGTDGKKLYSVASVFSLSAKAAADDQSLDGDQRQQVAATYARRAIDLLHEVSDSGYFHQADNLQELRQHTDFDPIRSQEDFKALVGRLKIKSAAQVKANGADEPR